MTEDAVPSPCRKICELGPDRVCMGCGRTIPEIARWRTMTAEQKLAVWTRLGREPPPVSPVAATPGTPLRS